MRKNILLDFLSPDNWKTYATIPKVPSEWDRYKLVSQLKQSLNIAILLTWQYCLLPPAFIVQSPIAFRAIFESSLYLDEHMIYLPLRETSIDRYIAKKVSEYEHVKDTHMGFYNDFHWTFLCRYQELLIHRNATMGITIAQQWINLSNESEIWKPIAAYDPREADRLRPIPMLLKERGESVTLEAVLAESKSTSPRLARYVNQAIQHEYLNAYIDEYDACILSCTPPKPFNENYLIKVDSQYYNFRLFVQVLDILGIKDYFLYAPPERILQFLREQEYNLLIDTYAEICEKQSNEACVKNVYRTLVKKTGKSMPPPLIFKSSVVKDRINRIADVFSGLPVQEDIIPRKGKKRAMRNITIIVTTSTEYTSTIKQFEKHGYQFEDDNSGDLFFKKTLLKNGVNISLVRTEMGANQAGGAFNTTHDVIDILDPDAIVICGICFGVKQGKDSPPMGDILVSTDIWDYETAKISDGIVDHRGKSIPVSTSLLQLFRRASNGFVPKVHFGVMGAGDKNVDDKEFIDKLLKVQPHMIGGDMEGYAVVSTCQSKKKDCILVKAICDWGYDKGDSFQQQAADNSLELVIQALESIKVEL